MCYTYCTLAYTCQIWWLFSKQPNYNDWSFTFPFGTRPIQKMKCFVPKKGNYSSKVLKVQVMTNCNIKENHIKKELNNI